MMKLLVFSFLLAGATAGIVTPVIDCGGAGTALQLRITGCSGAPPCNIIPGDNYDIEGDFIASADSDNIKFELIARTTSGLDIPVAEGFLGAIRGGLTYTATQTIRISDALSGETVIAQIRIIDVASSRVEICVQASMRVQ